MSDSGLLNSIDSVTADYVANVSSGLTLDILSMSGNKLRDTFAGNELYYVLIDLGVIKML